MHSDLWTYDESLERPVERHGVEPVEGLGPIF